MTDRTTQARKNLFFEQNLRYDPDTMPFGVEAEGERLELLRQGETEETAVSRLRREIEAIRARHEARRAGE